VHHADHSRDAGQLRASSRVAVTKTALSRVCAVEVTFTLRRAQFREHAALRAAYPLKGVCARRCGARRGTNLRLPRIIEDQRVVHQAGGRLGNAADASRIGQKKGTDAFPYSHPPCTENLTATSVAARISRTS